MQDAIDVTGGQSTSAHLDWRISTRLLIPAALGLAAALSLVAVYLLLVTWAQGLSHATQLLLGDWYFVAPISVGFGVQVGLFAHLRRLMSLRRRGSAGATTAAGTGTSTAAMLACCAHHVTDAMPVLGLSGAAIFLNDYRLPLMLAGMAVNGLGVLYMVRLVVRERLAAHGESEACFVPS